MGWGSFGGFVEQAYKKYAPAVAATTAVGGPTAGLIAAGSVPGVAAAEEAMKSLEGPGDPALPGSLPSMADDDTRKKAKEAADAEKRRSMNGRASTILTGGLGLSTRATTARTTLLGA